MRIIECVPKGTKAEVMQEFSYNLTDLCKRSIEAMRGKEIEECDACNIIMSCLSDQLVALADIMSDDMDTALQYINCSIDHLKASQTTKQ